MFKFLLLSVFVACIACNNNTSETEDSDAATKINSLEALSDSTSAAIDSSAHIKLDSIHAKDDRVIK